ncbi:hypothetical protein GCM10009534_47730 [Kribbella sandramycini]
MNPGGYPGYWTGVRVARHSAPAAAAKIRVQIENTRRWAGTLRSLNVACTEVRTTSDATNGGGSVITPAKIHRLRPSPIALPPPTHHPKLRPEPAPHARWPLPAASHLRYRRTGSGGPSGRWSRPANRSGGDYYPSLGSSGSGGGSSWTGPEGESQERERARAASSSDGRSIVCLPGVGSYS